MRWRQLRWCLAGVLGCALATPAEGRSPVGSDEERAREAERLARKAIRDGRKEEAIERYRAAWGHFKDPWYQCDMGGIEAEMGRARDATQSLTLCLRLLKPEAKEAIGRKVERILAEVRAQVGALRVEANVPDAEVAVDGKVLGKLPLLDPIFVDPGSHTVEVRAPGYQSDVRVAVLSAGASLRIPMRLEPMRVEVGRPPELDPVEPKPKPKEEARPPVIAPLSASAKAPDPILARDRITEPAPAPVRAAVILGGFGLGVAGAAVGVAGLMAAGAARSEAKATADSFDSTVCAGGGNDPCRVIYDKMDKVVTLTVIGIAGLAISAVGGGVVVYELVHSAPNETTKKAQVAFKVAPGEGALTLIGTF